ncbi:MAG: DUF4388 domain-containing protein [Deltaproteobacteria bacterium]|nr:DUF4388 domain-containing protein [Deltaproteobacteria bacterium]
MKGTVDERPLTDVFQLIGGGSMSGTLSVQKPAAPGQVPEQVRVAFHRGLVVTAEALPRPPNMRIGTMLVRAGLISEEQLLEALAEQNRASEKLGRILRSMGAISEIDLDEMLRLQTTETIHGLWSWQDGAYEFEASEIGPPEDIIDPIRAETLLMEGLCRAHLEPELRRRMPARDATITRRAPLPDSFRNGDYAASLFTWTGSSSPLKNLCRVDDLVTGERTVQEILDLSRLGEFRASVALIDLIENGFAGVAGDPDFAERIRPPARRRTFHDTKSRVVDFMSRAFERLVRLSTHPGDSLREAICGIRIMAWRSRFELTKSWKSNEEILAETISLAQELRAKAERATTLAEVEELRLRWSHVEVARSTLASAALPLADALAGPLNAGRNAFQDATRRIKLKETREYVRKLRRSKEWAEPTPELEEPEQSGPPRPLLEVEEDLEHSVRQARDALQRRYESAGRWLQRARKAAHAGRRDLSDEAMRARLECLVRGRQETRVLDLLEQTLEEVRETKAKVAKTRDSSDPSS